MLNKPSQPCPPLAERILAALTKAGHACTRGELRYFRLPSYAHGENSADVQRALNHLEASGLIVRVALHKPRYGPWTRDAWETVSREPSGTADNKRAKARE